MAHDYALVYVSSTRRLDTTLHCYGGTPRLCEGPKLRTDLSGSRTMKNRGITNHTPSRTPTIDDALRPIDDAELAGERTEKGGGVSNWAGLKLDFTLSRIAGLDSQGHLSCDSKYNTSKNGFGNETVGRDLSKAPLICKMARGMVTSGYRVFER